MMARHPKDSVLHDEMLVSREARLHEFGDALRDEKLDVVEGTCSKDEASASWHGLAKDATS